MSADAQHEFVDANVLVYAFDSSAGRKQRVAQRLVERLWEASTGCVSVPSAAGIFCNGHTQSRETVACVGGDRACWRVCELEGLAPTASDVLAAIALHTKAKIGFWEAMIVLAAAESGCDVLWTEDLNNGQVLQGVRIRDPFTEHE